MFAPGLFPRSLFPSGLFPVYVPVLPSRGPVWPAGGQMAPRVWLPTETTAERCFAGLPLYSFRVYIPSDSAFRNFMGLFGYAARIWGGHMNPILKMLFKTQYEQKTFGFDFSQTGPVLEGDTLSSPVVYFSPEDGSLSAGTPVILTSPFVEAFNGSAIPTGQGVKVRFSGGIPGTQYNVFCRVATSTGDTIEVDGVLSVLASANS